MLSESDIWKLSARLRSRVLYIKLKDIPYVVTNALWLCIKFVVFSSVSLIGRLYRANALDIT
jgi:hypothetical protein